MGICRTCWQSKLLCWLMWALALGGLLYLAGLTAWLGVAGLSFPYQLDYGEGVLLHFVRQWAQGQPIYRPIGHYPLITANYPPLTILLALALTPALGLTYTAGRLWTLLAVGAVALLIAVWVRREGGRWLPAVVAALLFVGSPYIYHWAPLFRADLVGLALTLGGLYAAWRSAESRRPALLGLAVVLFVAGLYAKQSFLFAPAAALAYLFFFVDRRQAIRMAAALVGLGGGLFALINVLTGGAFWESLVVSNVNPFLRSEFWKQQADFFGTFAVLGLLTAWYIVDKFVLDRTMPWRQKVSLLDLYLLTALLSLGLAGKAGAWENYFFEALAALALCGGLGLARLPLPQREREVAPLPGGRGRGRGKTLWLWLPPLLLLAQAALMWRTPRVAARYLRLTRQSNEAVAPLLARTPDPIISEDMGLLVTNGKALDYYSFQYSQLARAGRWDQAWELSQLRGRRLSLVILEKGTRLDVDRYQRFTREFLSELDRNYRRARTVGKYALYEPDPLQHEREADARPLFGDQLALVGWSLHVPPDLQAGDAFSLTVVWQAQQAPAADYVAFAHLVDGNGQGWAGDDHPPYDGLYPTRAWGAGEMVRDAFALTAPPDAPPGLYDVRVGWYHPVTQERLPVEGESSFRVAVLPVDRVGTGEQPLTPLEARFVAAGSDAAITLHGYAVQADAEAVRVTLRWSTDAYLDADYTLFLHLVAPEDGRIVAQGDAPPLAGRWPTSLWLPGVTLDDAHTIPLPPDLPPGRYHLLAGLYDPHSGQRLLLPDGHDALRLAEITLPPDPLSPGP